ncbi:putative 14 kDa proline-rich protein DC2.15 precursor [Corchorus capsularis]|uniref:Putative 14 kDa proline-rich protein DC2.15 n=1 Tax=Corchorus capsularis TaxID=210143 RepID=A0A1R3GNN7_COCAP|nr:putative 14 kDa proline-rich protein DC2.15 precursor [Corchorus capsularis]
MASSSKASTPIAFLLALNLLFFTLVSSQTPPPPPATCPNGSLTFNACVELISDVVLGVNIGSGTAQNTTCCRSLLSVGANNASTCICSTLRRIINSDTVPLPVVLGFGANLTITTVLGACNITPVAGNVSATCIL